MIWTIARKEMAEHVLSLRFSLAAVLCVLVVLVSCLGMYRQYEQRAQDYALCQARLGEARASIPPTLMSLFAWGLEDVTGKTIDLSPQFMPLMWALPLRAPLNIFDRFFPTFDLSYVMRVIGALVALGFAFDAVCGEGRSGTLALMLASGASRRGILLGKLAGGFPVVVILFLGPVIFGLTILSVFFSASLTFDMLIRSVLWGAGTVLYLFCFFCLGLLISSIITTPKVSLMACLVLWTLLIFVAPSAVTSLVRVETHLQSPVRFEQINYLTVLRLRSASGGQAREEREEAVQNQFQRHKTRTNEMLQFTDRTLTLLRVFPGAAYADLSTNLAGTGVPEIPRYYSVIQRYAGAVQAAREQNVVVPVFTFTRSGLPTCVQRSITDIISLVVWSAVVFWFAAVALSRYDARVKEAGQL